MKKIRYFQYLPYILVLIFGIWLTQQSQILTTLDQGDYGRAISGFLDGPADQQEYRHWEKPSLEWQFRDVPEIGKISNSSSVYFYANSRFQKLIRNSFSLPVLAITSKVILILILGFLSKKIAEQLQWGQLGTSAIWGGLLCAFFMGHNIYMLQSFYQEHVFWLGLPIIIAGLLDKNGFRSMVLILIGALLCGASKTQFFYIPTLLFAIYLLWNLLARKRLNPFLFIGLAAIQIICIFPIHGNPYKALNFYNATYYGSYLMLNQEQLDSLKVPLETRRCIGSDRWGALIKGEHGDERGGNIVSCFNDVSLTTADVIKPYLIDPGIIWRMWKFSEPALWTAKPFHNIREFPYIVTPSGLDSNGVAYPFPLKNVSLYLSDKRENYFTHRVGVFSILALIIFAFLATKKWLGNMPIALLFLVTLVWSQIFIALLGEGFRDLGKHYAAAQLSYDILLFFLGVSIVGALKKKFKEN